MATNTDHGGDSPPSPERSQPNIGDVFAYLEFAATPASAELAGGDSLQPYTLDVNNLLQPTDSATFWAQSFSHPDGSTEKAAGVLYYAPPDQTGSPAYWLSFGISQVSEGYMLHDPETSDPVLQMLLGGADSRALFTFIVNFLEQAGRQPDSPLLVPLDKFIQPA